MPHNPHAQLDQTVLEMIEHSPVGAVPHTPTFQDALKRLVTSHQVYASADHKGGYVTVRALAGAAAFSAKNLEAFLAGTVEESEVEEDASVFNRYVQSLPAGLRDKAEKGRAVVVEKRAHHRSKHGETVQDPAHSLFLVPGTGAHPGLAGNFLYGSVVQMTADAAAGGWAVHLHDAEDGAAVCKVATRAEALEKFQEVLASAPFQLSELAALGFRII